MWSFSWDQVMISLTGVWAVASLFTDNKLAKRLAPVIGLLGQPAWFASAITARQGGALIAACLFTAVWCYGIWRMWRPPR